MNGINSLCLHLRNGILILLLTFLACGTESGENLFMDKDQPSLLLSQAEGFLDPQSGEVFISPVSQLGRIGSLLFLGPRDQALLSLVNPNVGLQGWFTSAWDEVNQTGYLFQGSGACLTNLEERTILNLQARFTNFSSPSLSFGHGALAQGSDYIVRYQSLPSQETFCRSFSLTVPQGTSASFQILFEASALSSIQPLQYISRLDQVRLTFEPPQSADLLSGVGFLPNPLRRPTVLVDNTLKIPYTSSSNTNIDLSLRRTIDLNATDIGGEGFLTVQTSPHFVQPGGLPPLRRAIPGPYVMQPQILEANLRLPSGFGNLTRKVFWRTCRETTASSCEVVDGCLTHGEGTPLEAAEFAANTPLSEIQARTVQMTSVFTTNGAVRATAHVWVGFDLNNNQMVDAGDLYGYVPGVNIPRGQRVRIGDVILTGTVGTSCPL